MTSSSNDWQTSIPRNSKIPRQLVCIILTPPIPHISPSYSSLLYSFIETLYENIIDQITESSTELIRCLNSFHTDFFIYKADTNSFLKIFKLLISDADKLEELISDRRTSRAYEALLTCFGHKFSNGSTPEQVEDAKECLKTLGKFLVKNFENILDSENGIFTLRCFLRILGTKDPFEASPANQQSKNKKNKYQKTDFNIRNVEIKQVPDEWKIKKFLKKFALEDINLLGMICLLPDR